MKKNLKRKMAMALLLAAGIMSLGGCGKKTAPDTGEVENAPYGCSWAEQKDGSFQIQISGELPENSEWSISADSKVINVEQQETPGSFLVSPVAEGKSMLLLKLRQSEAPLDNGADFCFGFTVDENKKMTRNTATITKYDYESSSTENGTGVYWKQGNNGSLFVYLEGEEWSLSGCEGLIVMGPTAEKGISRMELVPEENAKAPEIRLINNAGEESIVISLEIIEGSLRLKSCGDLKAEETEEISTEPTAEENKEDSTETTPDKQELMDAFNNAKSEEERDALAEQIVAADKEAELKQIIEAWTERMGREPTEKELKAIKETLFGE